MTKTKPTARERAQRCYRRIEIIAERNIRAGTIDPLPHVEIMTEEFEAAAQAAREEERRVGECGKHPRACYEASVILSVAYEGDRAPDVCLACASEARAVEEAERRIGELAEDLMNERGRTLSAEARVQRQIVDFIRRGHNAFVTKVVLDGLASAIERGDYKKEG